MDEEQDVERDESFGRPGLDGEEVGGDNLIDVGLDEGVPVGLPFPVRRGRDTVLLQDVADGLIRDVVSKIVDRARDAIIAPDLVFAGESKDEFDDLGRMVKELIGGLSR